MDSSNNYVPGITHYEVVFVDRVGQKLRPIKMFQVDQAQDDCCRQAKYKIAMKLTSRDLQFNGYNGTINPVRLALTARAGHIYLPYFVFTDPIFDSTSGSVRVIEGRWMMKMVPAEARNLAGHPKVKDALGMAFALAAGLPGDDVFITGMWIEAQRVLRGIERRLEYVLLQQNSSGIHGRRLLCCPDTMMMCSGPACPVEVEVSYEVNSLNLEAAIPTRSEKFAEALTRHILQQVSAIGISISIVQDSLTLYDADTSVQGQFVEPVVTTTTTITKAVPATSRASLSVFHLLAAVIVVGTQVVF